MAALGWLMNLGFAAGGSAPAPVVEDAKRRRGAPKRKREWWEDGWVLPPHRKKEELPHVPAIAEAKQELAVVRRTKAAKRPEIRKLEARLGGIVRSANALERRIDTAKQVSDVEASYRALQAKVQKYTNDLERLKRRRIERLRADDDRLLQMIMEMD